MAENISSDLLGRKVFFLYPSALIQNQVVTELAQDEFEVYCSKNESRLKQWLSKFPDSILFANLNDGMKASAWDEWIRGIAVSSEYSKVDIGVISTIDDANLKNKYLGQLKIRCGYTVLKSDLPATVKQLTDILEGAHAKGRRKYIRAVTENEANTTVNLPINGTFINGTVKDISSVGFSCYFKEDPELTKNSLIPDIQIRLATQLIKAEGIVFGSRMEGDQKIYVILLSQRTSPDVRTRIRKFIQFFLQARMDVELK